LIVCSMHTPVAPDPLAAANEMHQGPVALQLSIAYLKQQVNYAQSTAIPVAV